MGSLSGGGRAIRPPTARSFPGQGLRTHAKNTLRTAPLQPAPEPVYEGGARSPPKPTNPYIVVSISQKRHFEQQKCKGFLHRLCKGFFGRVYRKNGAKREFWPSFGRKRPPSPRKSGKKRGGGLICRRRHSQKAQWGGLEDPQVRQSEFVSPGFSRSLNRRGGRWPRPPLVSLPTFGSLWPLRGQVPTGHTLPSGAGRAGSLRPWAQTFLKHPAKKIGVSRAFPTHDSRCRRCRACRGRRRRRGGSIPGAGAGEARKGAARRPTG